MRYLHRQHHRWCSSLIVTMWCMLKDMAKFCLTFTFLYVENYKIRIILYGFFITNQFENLNHNK